MIDSEVTILLPNKILYNERKNEESSLENSLNFNQNWVWDRYYDFEFYDEFEDNISDKEQKRQSEELIAVHEFDCDEESTPTIITIEEIEVEDSEISEESSISFCFRDIRISDSQLKIKNIFNSYPVPKDPGITTAFWCVFHNVQNYKEDSFEKYIDVVTKMKLKRISCLKKQFKENECNLRYYGLDPRNFKAIAEALIDNILVNTLDLKDNWLTVDTCYHLNELLLHNTCIVTLNLSGCRIGVAGARKIAEGLMFTPSLRNLNLSNCELGDEGLKNICSGIYLNESLQTLDLSDNHLNEKCAKDLETIISRSQTLIRLNLSWNSLHHKETCKAIFNALIDNSTIEEIDLSWNVIGSECISYVSSCLAKSPNLKILNLSWNRFVDIDQISKALAKNSVLKKFCIGNNPLTNIGASNLIKSLTLEKAPESKLRFLDLENVWVEKKILSVLEAIENTKPWLDVKLGGILGNFKLTGPNEKQLYLKRANFEAMNTKKKKERKNFGHFVLSLEDTAIPFKKFSELVKNFKLKLSDSLVHAIGKAFAVGQNLIDQGELKSFYVKEYPDTVLPPDKIKKIKKDEKNKKQPKNEPLKTKKEIKIKENKLKSKKMSSKIPEFEVLSREHESADILFEDFEANFEF